MPSTEMDVSPVLPLTSSGLPHSLKLFSQLGHHNLLIPLRFLIKGNFPKGQSRGRINVTSLMMEKEHNMGSDGWHSSPFSNLLKEKPRTHERLCVIAFFIVLNEIF